MLNLCVASLVVFFLGSTCGHIDIRKPPTITKQPNAIVYRSDDAVTLECQAEGIPGVSYEWKKNGLDLNPNQQNIDKGADGTITMRPATSTDEGFYQCFARNQYGTALSNTAHIQRAMLDSASATSTVLQKTVEEGKPFHIQANPIKSFPEPSYIWETADIVDKNPVPFRLTRRIQIAENGDLYFAYALPGDALDRKLYKSTTYNPALDVRAGGSYTALSITRNPAGINQFAPTIGFASAAPTVAVIGGSVTLRCFFYGNPEPVISWTGPRNTLPFGRYTIDSFNTELVINNITASDEGAYTCAGSNTQGRNTTTLQIRVEVVPRFLTVKDGPRDVNVTEEESFTFNCNADAKPKAEIVWLEDGRLLDSDKLPQRFVLSSDNRSLTIRDVCRDCADRDAKQTDLMVIQCNASNIHGYAFASGYLNVLSRTTVTILNKTDVEVYEDEEGRVQLDCNATSDPSTPPTFKWYKVEAEGDRLLYDEPPFVTVNAGQLSIHVTANATEKWSKYLGQYRCVVETGHSRVNETQDINPRSRPTVTAAVKTEYKWAWSSIGVAGIIGILFRVFWGVCKHIKENKQAGSSNSPIQASNEAGTEPSDPLKDTMSDDDVVESEQAEQSKSDDVVLTDEDLATSSTTELQSTEEPISVIS